MPRRVAPHTVICTVAGVLIWWLSHTSPAAGQDAILPHGDPRLQSSDEERARQEAVRDSRLKQQGQGSNYRIEGAAQPGRNQATEEKPDAPARQDTGIADPSVNPGQAEGMKSVQGRVIKSERNIHTVRQSSGGDTTLVVDASTAGDTDLQPGDLITGVLTPEGRAVLVQKEKRPTRSR